MPGEVGWNILKDARNYLHDMYGIADKDNTDACTLLNWIMLEPDEHTSMDLIGEEMLERSGLL
jgi:hypothetical protein